jgi:hypothetical protein
MLQLSIFLLLSTFLAASTAILVSNWLTQADGNSGAVLHMLERQNDIGTWANFNRTETKGPNIDILIDKDLKQQTIVGYGAGLPQSSASVRQK